MDRSLRILYNCIPHGVLEYDELRLLAGAGHTVFSLGDYWNRSSTVSAVREFHPAFFNDKMTALYLADPGCDYSTRSVSPEFCKNFDLIISSGVEVWMHQNFSSFGNLPVLFRTIGQSNLASENLLAHYGDRISIVRYSPAEIDLPGFAKTDAMIYFCKDPADFPRWVGGRAPVTFHSHYKLRDAISSPSISQYGALAAGHDAHLYGVNDPDGLSFKGLLHHAQQLDALEHAGCYLYVWSLPPSYTLSLVEAMMVGLPVVAPSAKFVSQVPPDQMYGWQPSRYEIDSLLSDGCGYVYDSIEEGREQIQMLLDNQDVAQDMSYRSRACAVSLFSIHTITGQWNAFLRTICR